MDDGLRDFEDACRFDRAGDEEAAIPCYQRALAKGLPRDVRCQALVGLGSSLRCVSRHEEAVRVLRGAVTEYEGHAALRAFLALSLHSLGQSDEALAILLGLVISDSAVGPYARSLTEYAGQLMAAVRSRYQTSGV